MPLPAKRRSVRKSAQPNRQKEWSKAKKKAISRKESSKLLGIKQTAVATTKKPFGGAEGKDERAFDAFDPTHMPMPRAVAPYSVWRSTMNRQTTAQVVIVCPSIITTSSGSEAWSSIIAYESAGPASVPSGVVATRFVPMPSVQTLESNVSLAPNACSVQIMNGEAVQTTTGVVYGGTSTAQLTLKNEATLTWTDIAENFVSYMSPRVMSAAKLAFRGVQVDSIPMNNVKLGDFMPLEKAAQALPYNGPWDNTNPLEPSGCSPIVVYNPQGLDLTYLICVEWKCRFGLANPASGSHQHHKPTTVAKMAGIVKGMTGRGHGMRDLPEVVAGRGER